MCFCVVNMHISGATSFILTMKVCQIWPETEFCPHDLSDSLRCLPRSHVARCEKQHLDATEPKRHVSTCIFLPSRRKEHSPCCRLGGITTIRGITFRYGAARQVLFVCAVPPEDSPWLCAAEHQNRKMQTRGREKEWRREREGRAFTAVVKRRFL